jgi:hypothetical protein
MLECVKGNFKGYASVVLFMAEIRLYLDGFYLDFCERYVYSF